MFKNFAFIFFLFIAPFIAKAENITYKNETLDWIENIPIFPKLIIDKKNTVEFDSVQGKILVAPFFVNNEDITLMKKFYNNFFKNSKWIRIDYSSDIFLWEKKLSEFSKRKFSVKKNNVKSWSLNFVVENF